ncbi:MAG: hypothetical protein U9Q99_02360 [Nanoarchaeota archaeon]|nr:hypothetical protein [Nanoarchaeota archaeon]
MNKKFYNLINKLSIVEVFKDLYPHNKIEEEINPNTGIKLYKTFSPFLKHNSKLPQLYFNEKSIIGPGYFDFDSGQKGYIPNLLVWKFEDFENSNDGILKSKKSLEYLSEKLKIKLEKLNEKDFLKDFENLYMEPFYDAPIFEQSLLANNPCAITDGNWVNYYTDKWEGWNKIE